ncbi:alpha/beta family hydrolase [Ruania zhangjianzhongii]|uniref:alpha/beta hydrolase family protein n=1 Tax=Ruania zhangjianzhongii TaxID=2603206 RepID=UPI0011CB455E|nr:alpha/beta family hydrolase [Ruania zhangjianzhongii]
MRLPDPQLRTIDTPHGPARAHLHRPAGPPAAALVLGHGAGGGVAAKDLVAAAGAALQAGWLAVLVEQPYRVAGRRAPAPAKQLDAAWRSVLAELAETELTGLPVVTGGRSSGARVSCRTAGDGAASGVLCLAFPLLPPGKDASKSRLAELAAVEVPVLVVQGSSDRFGMPPAAPGRQVVTLRGTHSLDSDLPGLATAVGDWLGHLG